jgi:hypothetical protein
VPRLRAIREWSAFDQPDVAGAWALGRILDLELDALSFPQELEHGTPDGAAMEKVFDAALIADEAESLIDE